jgi:hypothetical protein
VEIGFTFKFRETMCFLNGKRDYIIVHCHIIHRKGHFLGLLFLLLMFIVLLMYVVLLQMFIVLVFIMLLVLLLLPQIFIMLIVLIMLLQMLMLLVFIVIINFLTYNRCCSSCYCWCSSCCFPPFYGWYYPYPYIVLQIKVFLEVDGCWLLVALAKLLQFRYVQVFKKLCDFFSIFFLY